MKKKKVFLGDGATVPSGDLGDLPATGVYAVLPFPVPPDPFSPQLSSLLIWFSSRFPLYLFPFLMYWSPFLCYLSRLRILLLSHLLCPNNPDLFFLVIFYSIPSVIPFFFWLEHVVDEAIR